MPSQQAIDDTNQVEMDAAAEPIIIDNLTGAQLESLFLHFLDESKPLSYHDEAMNRQIAMAKMLNYCIRMLHSHGWVPRTVVRAMVLMEAGATPNRSVKGHLYQALRERRNEIRAVRASKNLDTSAAAELASDGGQAAGNNSGKGADAKHADVCDNVDGNGAASGGEGSKSASSVNGERPENKIEIK